MLSQTGNSEPQDPAQTPPALSELLDEYAAFATRVRSLAQDTVKTQRLYLERFLAALEAASPSELFASLTAATLQRFIFAYAEDHGSGSRRWMQFTLRSFLRFCYCQGYLSGDLSPAIPAFSSPRLSSGPKGTDDDTVRLLIESIDTHSPLGLRDLAIILMLSTYGVRGIQVRLLCLHDIDWVNSRIYFRPVKNGKPITQHLTP